MSDLKDIYTIVYYTSNREDPVFEKKIQQKLIENSNGIPIISVSQKPIELGTNICVGTEVGFSDQNGMRQMLIGAKEAKTPYIIFAESDFLYPPEHFTFVPPDENECYRCDNVWIAYKQKRFGGYQRKRYSEGAQICGRELLIEYYEKYFEDLPMWRDASKDGTLHRRGPLDWRLHQFKWIHNEIPCISFKTGDGVRKFTGTMREVPHEQSLPYWGDINNLREQYL